MPHIRFARIVSWATSGAVAIPMLFAIAMSALKALRMHLAGYAIGNEPVEVFIFGGVAVLLLALVSALPTIIVASAFIRARPAADTWSLNLIALPSLCGLFLLAFSGLLESGPSVGGWLISVGCVLLPRVLLTNLRPGQLLWPRAG